MKKANTGIKPPANRGAKPVNAPGGPAAPKKKKKKARSGEKGQKAAAQKPAATKKKRRKKKAGTAGGAAIEKRRTTAPSVAQPAKRSKRAKVKETFGKLARVFSIKNTEIQASDSAGVKLFKGVGGWSGIVLGGAAIGATAVVLNKWGESVSLYVGGGLLLGAAVLTLSLVRAKPLRRVAQTAAVLGTVTVAMEVVARRRARAEGKGGASA